MTGTPGVLSGTVIPHGRGYSRRRGAWCPSPPAWADPDVAGGQARARAAGGPGTTRSTSTGRHVYARLFGFGWTLLPLAPFRFERVPGGPCSVVVVRRSAGGVKRAPLSSGGNNLPDVELGEGTASLEEVLDLCEGSDRDHWRVETTVFTIRRLAGFALESSAGPGPPGFHLHGPDATLLYVQGPFPRGRLPAPSAMAGPGQTVRRHGDSWVELEYFHEGTPWRQTHWLVGFLQDHAYVVSVQAPERLSGLAEAAVAEVAESLEPYQDG